MTPKQALQELKILAEYLLGEACQCDLLHGFVCGVHKHKTEISNLYQTVIKGMKEEKENEGNTPST